MSDLLGQWSDTRVFRRGERSALWSATEFTDHDELQLSKYMTAALSSGSLLLGQSTPPIHLPSELLSRIFVEICSDTYFFDLVSPFPNPLLSVCRRWRSIALDTPGVWAQIQLNIYAGSDIRLKAACLAALDGCLSRARSTPLDISIRLNMQLTSETVNQYASKAIAAITHADRMFGSLDFSGPVEHLSTLLTSSAGQSLHHLSVSLHDRDSVSAETLPAVTLPKLQSLHIYTYRQWDSLHSIRAPELSTLFLQRDGMLVKELGQISSQFPQITTLLIDGVVSGSATETLDIQFRRLLKCDWMAPYMNEVTPSYDMRLFNGANQLTQLTIGYYDQLCFTTLTPLPSLRTLRILNPNYTSLVTRARSPGVSGMISFLRYCPNVTEICLTILRTIFVDVLLQHLTPKLRDLPPDCPALNHLILDESYVSVPYLKTFLMERNGLGAVPTGRKPHRFYDTWAPSCLLSCRHRGTLPKMCRATFPEVQAAMEMLDEDLRYIERDDSPEDEESISVCEDCEMVFENCECADAPGWVLW